MKAPRSTSGNSHTTYLRSARSSAACPESCPTIPFSLGVSSATEVLKLAQYLEDLTRDAPACYTATAGARVEAKATLEQAEELVRVLMNLQFTAWAAWM